MVYRRRDAVTQIQCAYHEHFQEYASRGTLVLDSPQMNEYSRDVHAERPGVHVHLREAHMHAWAELYRVWGGYYLMAKALTPHTS